MTEVEIKLLLGNKADFEKTLSALLQAAGVSEPLDVEIQRNAFLDTTHAALKSQAAYLRLRTATSSVANMTAVLTLKRNPLLCDGVMRVGELECNISEDDAARVLSDPGVLAGLDNVVVRELASMGLDCSTLEITCEFGNTRTVTPFVGRDGIVCEERAELDVTEYPFGVMYSLEMETKRPEETKPLLEAFLRDRQISFAEAVCNKLDVLRSGHLPLVSP